MSDDIQALRDATALIDGHVEALQVAVGRGLKLLRDADTDAFVARVKASGMSLHDANRLIEAFESHEVLQ